MYICVQMHDLIYPSGRPLQVKNSKANLYSTEYFLLEQFVRALMGSRGCFTILSIETTT